MSVFGLKKGRFLHNVVVYERLDYTTHYKSSFQTQTTEMENPLNRGAMMTRKFRAVPQDAQQRQDERPIKCCVYFTNRGLNMDIVNSVVLTYTIPRDRIDFEFYNQANRIVAWHKDTTVEHDGFIFQLDFFDAKYAFQIMALILACDDRAVIGELGPAFHQISSTFSRNGGNSITMEGIENHHQNAPIAIADIEVNDVQTPGANIMVGNLNQTRQQDRRQRALRRTRAVGNIAGAGPTPLRPRMRRGGRDATEED